MLRNYRKIALVAIFALLLSCTPYMPLPKAAAATVNESENNNSGETADVTQDDNTNYGAITSYSDEDWWKITFSSSGMANFWLGDIPSGCNYAIHVKTGSTAYATVAFRDTGTGNSRLVKINVKAGTTYYVQIFSMSGYSTQKYTLRVKRYNYRPANMFTSNTDPYGNNFRPTATGSYSYIWSMGFGGQEYLNNTASEAFESVPYSDITVFAGHGYSGGGGAFFYDENGVESIIYATAANSSQLAISNYGWSGLDGVKLIIFDGCDTGLTSTTRGNLVDAAIAKGTYVAIGWKQTIHVDGSTDWIIQFFKNCAQSGGSMEGALNRTDLWMEANNRNRAAEMANRYVGNSKPQALKL